MDRWPYMPRLLRHRPHGGPLLSTDLAWGICGRHLSKSISSWRASHSQPIYLHSRSTLTSFFLNLCSRWDSFSSFRFPARPLYLHHSSPSLPFHFHLAGRRSAPPLLNNNNLTSCSIDTPTIMLVSQHRQGEFTQRDWEGQIIIILNDKGCSWSSISKRNKRHFFGFYSTYCMQVNKKVNHKSQHLSQKNTIFG